MSNSVLNTHNCYGCGVCAVVCPHKIINIELNNEGFYEPIVRNADKCADCGLCVDVCSYSDDKLASEYSVLKSYAGWSKDDRVRRKCSSGGIGFELGLRALQNGMKVCGVQYNAEKGIAEHYIASTPEDLIKSIGSKYIQSYTVDGFREANRKEKYLVTGTPCQIDSFRRYIKKFHCEENFILMDFFCHGVPSILLWKKYCEEAEKEVGKITYVSWRNKFTGWHDSWAMGIDGLKCGESVNWHDSYNLLIKEKKTFYNSRLSQGDAFYQLFLGNSCLGRACYSKCKFKYDRSSADIRIGDAWGETYRDNEDGVSAVVCFTERGDAFLRSTNCDLLENSIGIVAEGQMKKGLVMGEERNLVLKSLQDGKKELNEVLSLLKWHYRKQKLCRLFPLTKRMLK